MLFGLSTPQSFASRFSLLDSGPSLILASDLRGATSLPSYLSFSRTGNATMFDATGKLTYAPNNLYVNSSLSTNTARTITTEAGVNYYIWIKTSTGTATIVASGTNTSTFNGSAAGTFTAFTATSGALTLTPTSNYANITQVVVAAVTYETGLRSVDNVVTGSAAYYGPRFWYEPASLSPMGMLFEPAQETNLLTYSEQFDNSDWSPGLYFTAVTANATTAPDGTLTADKIVADTSDNAHILRRYNLPTFAGSTTYTLSAFVERAGYDVALQLYDGGLIAKASFNLSNATIITTAGSATITSVGNGRYRCSVTGTTKAVPDISLADIQIYKVGSPGSFPGDGVSGIYSWGAMLNTGSSVGSYVRTGSAAVTRAAESLSPLSYSSNPAILQYRTPGGTRARKVLSAFSSISSESAESIELVAIYALNTPISYLNSHLTVDGSL